MEQLTLFELEEYKLSDIVEYVRNRGKWQSNNCYVTEVVQVHDTIIVSNHFTYGDKSKKEGCMDSCLLDIDKSGKYCRLSSIFIWEIDYKKISEKPFWLNEELYKNYCIKIDVEITKKEKL